MAFCPDIRPVALKALELEDDDPLRLGSDDEELL
jgi:hypothetical protein